MTERRRDARKDRDAIARALAGEGHLRLVLTPQGPILTTTDEDARPASGGPPSAGSTDEGAHPEEELELADPEVIVNRERIAALRQQRNGVSDISDLIMTREGALWTAFIVAVVVFGSVLTSRLILIPLLAVGLCVIFAVLAWSWDRHTRP
jgi:hypothetical protein